MSDARKNGHIKIECLRALHSCVGPDLIKITCYYDMCVIQALDMNADM